MLFLNNYLLNVLIYHNMYFYFPSREFIKSDRRFKGLIVLRLKTFFGYVAEKLYNHTNCRHRVFWLKSSTVQNIMLFKSFSATVVSEFSSSAIDGVGI